MCEIVDDWELSELTITDDDLLSSYHSSMAHYIEKWIQFKTVPKISTKISSVRPEYRLKTEAEIISCPICKLRFKKIESLNYHRDNSVCKNHELTPEKLSDEQKEELKNYENYGCLEKSCEFRSRYK